MTDPMHDRLAYVPQQDREHLRILSILYYVYAAFMGLGGLCGTAYMIFFFAFFVAGPGSAGQPPEGRMMMGVMGVVSLLGLGFAFLVTLFSFLAARFLGRGDHYVFCLCVAVLVCLNIPLGTALGVFTIIVLLRPAVRDAFVGTPPHPPDGA
jgi:hypothetical protein